jgi:hypothetical protein
MKLIFLDIDGVLLSHMHSPEYNWRSEPFPRCHASALNEILRLSGANVVMTSCHNIHHSSNIEYTKWMHSMGVTNITRVIGKTRYHGDRTSAIVKWLHDHNDHMIDGICIIDDELIGLPIAQYHLHTNMYNGLQSWHVDAVLQVLKLPYRILNMEN